MRVLLGAPQTVRLHGPGGLIVQILQTKAFLEKRGHEVTLFNPWDSFDPRSYDIFHLFFAMQDTYNLGERIKQSGLKFVVSPIIDKAIPEVVIRAANNLVMKAPKIHTNLSLACALCKLADLVVVRSAEEFDKVTKGFGIGSSKVIIVPNGVDTKYSYASPALFTEKYATKDFVLSVGLIGNPVKNHYRLIRVLGQLQAPAILVGPVWNNDYARRCLELADRHGNIRILGILEEAELVSAYAAADTLALPSIVEGTGLVALEAGLAGAKIVVTKHGGAPYYFENLVEYVDPYSEKSIREGLQRSLAKPKDCYLRDHIQSLFTWERVLPELERAYAHMLL